MRRVMKVPSSMNKPQKEQGSRSIDPELWVDRYEDYLYAFAQSWFVDRTTAEDIVQETFLSALNSIKNFKGHSSERTWLTSILKHKILDHFRKRQRGKIPMIWESHKIMPNSSLRISDAFSLIVFNKEQEGEK